MSVVFRTHRRHAKRMCGRYKLAKDRAVTAQFFQTVVVDALPPRWNIAPTSQVPIIMARGLGRQLSLARWGLIPSWSKEQPTKFSTFNARSETAATSPVFRGPYRSKRCLIPTDGFYEWHAQDHGGKVQKQPFMFELPDGELFAFAGIYDIWTRADGTSLLSCSILTREALSPVKQIHTRSPVMLKSEDYDQWLAPKNGVDQEAPLLASQLTLDLTMTPISDRINSAKTDNAGVVQPINSI